MADWLEVDLSEVRRAFVGRREVFEAVEHWVTEKNWRVRKQGHKFALWPPDPGFRLMPPFVRVDGTVKSDATWQARIVHRDCRKLENSIKQRRL